MASQTGKVSTILLIIAFLLCELAQPIRTQGEPDNTDISNDEINGSTLKNLLEIVRNKLMRRQQLEAAYRLLSDPSEFAGEADPRSLGAYYQQLQQQPTQVDSDFLCPGPHCPSKRRQQTQERQIRNVCPGSKCPLLSTWLHVKRRRSQS